MTKILVTGAAGYIGSHAVRNLLQQGHEVVALDNFSHGWREALVKIKKEKDFEIIEADLRQAETIKQVMLRVKPTMVFHFAALCSVNESMTDPAGYFANNIGGTLNLLIAMQEAAVSQLIFSSTCAVYGEVRELPVKEDHPTVPVSPYGESKLIAEKMIQWFGQIYDWRYVIFRYFNVCGAAADGLIGDSKQPSELLVQNAVRSALGLAPFTFTCPTVATPDGTPIRDFIDVEDLVRAHCLAAEYLAAGGVSEIFNLGNGCGYSVKEIVAAVEDCFKLTLPQQVGPTRHGEDAQIYANADKAKKVLGWQPQKTLNDSLASLATWYKKHPQGFKM